MDIVSDEAIIKEYINDRESISKLSKKYHTSNKKIKEILTRNNIRLRTSSEFNRRYVHQYDFFHHIDTEQKAYWLGFILADGYLTPRSNTVGIELKSTEIGHLEKFKRDIKATNPIRIYKKDSTFGEQETCRIELSKKETLLDLIKLGLTNNKSYDGRLPQISLNLKHHVIRGYFDGNGCITTKKDGRFYSISFCGTKEILQSIENSIDNFTWYWSKRKEGDNNNYTIATGQQKQVEVFLDYIYKDATVFLDRKYDKYLEFKKMYD